MGAPKFDGGAVLLHALKFEFAKYPRVLVLDPKNEVVPLNEPKFELAKLVGDPKVVSPEEKPQLEVELAAVPQALPRFEYAETPPRYPLVEPTTGVDDDLPQSCDTDASVPPAKLMVWLASGSLEAAVAIMPGWE